MKKKRNWRKDVAEGLEQFRTQNEHSCTVKIIHVEQMPNLLRSAEAGDQRARVIVIAIANWQTLANRAYDDGVLPGCCCCPTDIDRGEVCGFVLIEPTIEGIGTVAVFCIDCAKHDNDWIFTQCTETLSEEIGVTLAPLQ